MSFAGPVTMDCPPAVNITVPCPHNTSVCVFLGLHPHHLPLPASLPIAVLLAVVENLAVPPYDPDFLDQLLLFRVPCRCPSCGSTLQLIACTGISMDQQQWLQWGRYKQSPDFVLAEIFLEGKDEVVLKCYCYNSQPFGRTYQRHALWTRTSIRIVFCSLLSRNPKFVDNALLSPHLLRSSWGTIIHTVSCVS